MSSPYRIRRATKRDVPALVRHRVEMFRAMTKVRDRDAAVIAATFGRHLASALPRRKYLGWVAVHGREVVAGVGVVPRRRLPAPPYPRGGLEAYVLNVYTEPAHRRRGLARRLMKEVLAWSRRNGANVVSLHASDEGRPVYTGLGFKDGREMRIRLARR